MSTGRGESWNWCPVRRRFVVGIMHYTVSTFAILQSLDQRSGGNVVSSNIYILHIFMLKLYSKILKNKSLNTKIYVNFIHALPIYAYWRCCKRGISWEEEDGDARGGQGIADRFEYLSIEPIQQHKNQILWSLLPQHNTASREKKKYTSFHNS